MNKFFALYWIGSPSSVGEGERAWPFNHMVAGFPRFFSLVCSFVQSLEPSLRMILGRRKLDSDRLFDEI